MIGVLAKALWQGYLQYVCAQPSRVSIQPPVPQAALVYDAELLERAEDDPVVKDFLESLSLPKP